MRGLVPVLVARVSDGEAAVPSRVVSCASCGADCWLSIKTGNSTLALASIHGTPMLTCMPCLERAMGLAGEAGS